MARAAGWFKAPERLAKLGDNLRRRLQRSPLMDHAGCARELTAALEGLTSRLDGDPVDVMPLGVFGEHTFILYQDSPDNR